MTCDFFSATDSSASGCKLLNVTLGTLSLGGITLLIGDVTEPISGTFASGFGFNSTGLADIVSSGLCWVPQTRWAEELVDEVAGFPFMPHDDLVDSTVMALMRFRQGGFVTLPTDEPEEQRFFKQRRGGYY